MKMDKDFLKETIRLSEQSVAAGGYPAGALVVFGDKIIGKGISDGKRLKDPTSHAEIAAIREASKALSKRDLKGAIIYSSMEPCLMCFSASYWAAVSKIVFACAKDKLSKQHYEGLHDLNSINRANNRMVELVQLKELENEALEVINDWENKQ
jgi:tRNA(Arg) A34 adenosine deaminase TadA